MIRLFHILLIKRLIKKENILKQSPKKDLLLNFSSILMNNYIAL